MANYAKTNIENEGRVELHETRSRACEKKSVKTNLLW